MRKSYLVAGFLLMVVLAVAILSVFRGESAPEVMAGDATKGESAKAGDNSRAGRHTAAETGRKTGSAKAEAVPEEEPEKVPEEPKTEEERRAEDEEKRVDAFDDLTDEWQEPASEKVTMKEVERFREQFNRVPKERKDECIHRALNLIPDENVMLLAGILFDKTQEKETLETVYNDILNRDESVKKPILQSIFKDKSHPCWADTAWILDVTGELPAKGKVTE